MKHLQPFLLAALLCLAAPRALHAQTWETLAARPYPAWFSDAKLGIFVHWGLYSVPAYASKEGYGEWFYRGLMLGDSTRRQIMSLYTDTTLPVMEQYRALTRHWHAELWHPDEWADLFQRAGARYVVLVTKHHDGYCLWDSPQQPEWNSTVSGPRRNIVDELTRAVRRKGLKMGFYYSLPEWSNPRHIWMEDADSTIGDYVDNYMVPQFKELVLRYRPSLIFADGDWLNTPEQLRSAELIDWYYRTVGDEAIVNDRWGQGTPHGFRTPEYSAGIAPGERPWAECRGVGRSFGLNRNESLDNYLTDGELIRHFCVLVAHGGGLTLNVGPYADGTIPLIQQERLRVLGRWLEVNGEAIYASRPWHTTSQQEPRNAELPTSRTIVHDWVRNAPLAGMPVDHFGIEWQGVAEVPADGDYTIRLATCDHAVLLGANGDTLLGDSPSADWTTVAEGLTTVRERTLHLRRGALPLRLSYREDDMEAAVRLEWSRDGGRTFSPIAAEWKGTASWQHTNRCFTTRDGNLYVIEFEQPYGEIVIPGMPRLERGTTIALLGCDGTLRWRQKRDGTLVVDVTKVPPEQLRALHHAWVLRIF